MIRVALIDAGVAERHAPRVVAARAFRRSATGEVVPEDGLGAATCGPTTNGAATNGALAHGAALADVLLADARIELVAARVFGERLVSSAAQLAAALDWAVEHHAMLANLSTGLREDREVLREAVARALGRGVVLVAASPARGEPVYPAAYPGVLRATGDARCAPGEYSWLGGAHADFGAHVRAGTVRGASAACAHVSAQLAALLADGAAPAEALEALRERAHYTGPEHHAR